MPSDHHELLRKSYVGYYENATISRDASYDARIEDYRITTGSYAEKSTKQSRE